MKKAILAVVLGGSLGLIGCATVMQPTVRTNVAAYGAQWFQQAGHPLQGGFSGLTCENEANTSYLVCTGVTVNGQNAVMSGQVPSAELAGVPFVGKVAGQQVFKATVPNLSY